MRAPFAHLAMMQHENLVGVDNRAQTMRDRDCRPTAHQHRERALDFGFDLTVHRARRLIQNQERPCFAIDHGRLRDMAFQRGNGTVTRLHIARP